MTHLARIRAAIFFAIGAALLISAPALAHAFVTRTDPVDGAVLEGRGVMDESYLTGEPFEITKTRGSRVISGAINGDVALTVRATARVVDSRYAKITEVMRESADTRPQLRRLGDQLGAPVGNEGRQARGAVALGTGGFHETVFICIPMAEGLGIAGKMAGVIASQLAHIHRRGEPAIQIVDRVIKQLDNVLGVMGKGTGILGSDLIVEGRLQQARRPGVVGNVGALGIHIGLAVFVRVVLRGYLLHDLLLFVGHLPFLRPPRQPGKEDAKDADRNTDENNLAGCRTHDFSGKLTMKDRGHERPKHCTVSQRHSHAE